MIILLLLFLKGFSVVCTLIISGRVKQKVVKRILTKGHIPGRDGFFMGGNLMCHLPFWSIPVGCSSHTRY